MKYCENCGAELLDDAVMCPNCGAIQDNQAYGSANGTVQSHTNSSNSTLKTVAFVFMIISLAGCVLSSLTSIGLAVVDPIGFVDVIAYLVPLAWSIPMTIKVYKARKNNEPLSTGFKVCTLIFVNLVAGILLLCDKDQ